jgi:integrase
MAKLRERNELGARALEFTVLTATRTGEATGAQWHEFDLKAKMWTVRGHE